jgi:class 3 adenylate cyclase/tetratricopeptide (TPR) repeat protein
MADSPPKFLCQVCSTPYAQGQYYCGNCGESLVTACPICNTENPAHHRFCLACGSPLPTTSPAERPLKYIVIDKTEKDERRWVTVLFVDVAGFTGLSERLDPEEVMEFAARCADRISEVVRRFGGSVLRVIGDEVFAVFGAPVAHEDDAERAVRAALSMLELKITDAFDKPVHLHVGINTGEALFGRIGPQEVRDFTVMGDIVNTAARLRSAAPPGIILVGEETYRETAYAIRYLPRTSIQAKGKGQPVAAYQAVEAITEPRERTLGTAPLVGRSSELNRLENMYHMVVEKQQPHLATIIGEPGIGKSRLAAEFEQRLPESTQKMHGRCLPYGESLGYGAVAMALKEVAHVRASDDLSTSRKKLTDLVFQVFEDSHKAAEVDRALALLIGLDLENDHLDDPIDQRIQHASLRQFLEVFSRKHPIYLNIDDIQWADEALLDLMEYIAGRARESALLIVTQARPELLEKRPFWGRGVRSFTSIPLSALDKFHERDLILELLKERGLPGDLVDRVGSSAGGNPLFAEELVAMIAESGPGTGIPSLIKLLIAARLDALPPNERTLIQLASIYGKVFWVGGLRPLGIEREPLALLDALEQKDLLRGLPMTQFKGELEYAFKHDLIRDVAYEMLPKANRRILHNQAADWMETAAGERIETYLDQLAHHAYQAGQLERALEYLKRAAERASRSGAFRQAASLLRQAIEISEGLGRQDLVAASLGQRAKAYLNVGMWSEARQDLLKQLDITPVDRIDQLASIHLDLSECSIGLLQTVTMRKHSEEALKLAEQAGREDLAGAALANLSVAASSDGDLHESVRIYERALLRSHGRPMGPTSSHAFQVMTHYWLGSYEKAISQAELVREQIHGDVASLLELHGNAGAALTGLGRYGEAEKLFSEGIRLAREYEVWPYVARTTSISAGYHLELYDYTGHEVLAQEARQVAQENNFMSSLVSATIDLLFNYARIGEVGKAEQLIPEVREAMQGASGFHNWLWQLRFSQAQSEIAFARGDIETAFSLASQAKEQSILRNRPKYEALALITRAKTMASKGQVNEAVKELSRATEVGRRIGDPAIHLRIGLELVRIHDDENTAHETIRVANRVLSSLPEGKLRESFEENEGLKFLFKQVG